MGSSYSSPNCIGGLVKPPLKIWHGWVITSPKKLPMDLFFHSIIWNHINELLQDMQICYFKDWIIQHLFNFCTEYPLDFSSGILILLV